MKVLGVYFREFSSGEYELGILEDHGYYRIMDTGDFAYGWEGTIPWIYIGAFE
jgi:hypothetical protein